jgi:hypothetical protein
MTEEQFNAIRELLRLRAAGILSGLWADDMVVTAELPNGSRMSAVGPKSYRSLVRRCKAVQSQKKGVGLIKTV